MLCGVWSFPLALVLRAWWTTSVGGTEIYVVGGGEYVLGPAAYDFDNPLTWMLAQSSDPTARDHDIVAYSANARSYMVARGADLKTGMFKEPVYTGLNASSNPEDLDHCGAWLNAVHWDRAKDVVRGFYHQEWHCNYSHSAYTNMSIAYAESTDGGKTFTKPGHPDNAIITAPNSSATHITGEGGHGMAVRDGYYYIYFRDWSTFGVGVARATVSSGGVPGSWFKFYNGEWSQPGIRGNASRILDVTGTSVYYSASRDKFVSIGYWSNKKTIGRGPRLSTSSDGINWNMMELPLQPLDPQNWNRTGKQPELYAYQALAPTSDSDDVFAANTFYISYTYVEPGDTRIHKYLCRKEVTMHHLPLPPGNQSGQSAQSTDVYTLIQLRYYVKRDSTDTWITSAALPPHRNYTSADNTFSVLPLLASAPWPSLQVLRQNDDVLQEKGKVGKNSAETDDQFVSAAPTGNRGWLREAPFMQGNIDAMYGSPSSFDYSMAYDDRTSKPTREREQTNDQQAEILSKSAMFPVYDCLHSNGDHFVSNSSSCLDEEYIRILGYVLAKASVNTAQRVLDALFGRGVMTPSPIYFCYLKKLQNSCLDVTENCDKCGGDVGLLLGYGFTLNTKQV